MKITTLLTLILSFASLTAFADDPAGRYDGFTLNGFRLHSVEYWGNGNYDGGNGVSFGYLTNDKDWNRSCARTAWTELKRILKLNTPEMRALREAGGPTGIYIIISDWTESLQPGKLEPASVWHYNADQNGRGGLIKFHAQSHSGSGAHYLCNSPKEEQLIQFAIEAKKKIDESGN
ncbi:MAG TPA: hypothetical protein VIH99_09740 [Bdellovibrionota bacterium]|jgi:hypothetical protein